MFNVSTNMSLHSKKKRDQGSKDKYVIKMLFKQSCYQEIIEEQIDHWRKDSEPLQD